MKLKNIILSWDFLLSLFLTIIFLNISVCMINFNTFIDLTTKLVETGVTVFSVIFPLFFASLTVIITSSDDEFANFLQERGYYYSIISSFRFTLGLLFVAFLLSFALSVAVEIIINSNNQLLLYGLIIIYFFIVLYSLFATYNSILDSIKYAHYRGEYFKIKRN